MPTRWRLAGEAGAGEAPSTRVYEDEKTVAFLDIFPGTDAWQTVFHFHLHVIPRYAGRDGVHAPDGLKVPWTPGVLGDPDVAADLGAKLTAALAAD